MLRFYIAELMAGLGKAVANEDLGVEKSGEYLIHESLSEIYLKSVMAATEAALKERLKGTAQPVKSG
jgi:hypothetical protein